MSKIKIFCEFCGLEMELTNYRLHCRTAHKKQEESKKKAKKEFICEICNKICFSKFNLNYHLAHHYNLKNYKCDSCPNAYNTKSDLNQHKKTHGNKTGKEQNDPIECSICNKSFSSTWHLGEHFKKHAREKEQKSFECNECDKVFRQAHSLKEHIETVHRGLKKYHCIVCGKAFGKIFSLISVFMRINIILF